MTHEPRTITVAEAIDQAEKLMLRAHFLKVIATGETLAEIEGKEWEFWALGASPYLAKVALSKTIATTLLKRLGHHPEGSC